MKKALKYLVYSLAKPFYALLRHIWEPSDKALRKLRFRGKVRVMTPEGTRITLYNPGFHLETRFFWLGWEGYSWERMTRRVWAALCPHAGTIFDIGANTGIYALLAAAINNPARVYAFEPQPNIFSVLERNKRINRFDIHCENLALSDRSAELPFYNYGPDTWSTENTTAGSLNADWHQEAQESIRVPVERLDNFIRQHEVGRIDLMKIDVETLEYEVLSGYGPALLEDRPLIILEIQHPGIGLQVTRLLEPAGYQYYHIDESLGLSRVERPGRVEGDLNYLCCPPERLALLKDFMTNP